jgi:hypothetical protein
MKRLLTDDPLTGSKTYFHYDPMTKKITLEDVQDVTEIVERNRVMQNSGLSGYTKSKDMKHVATIPLCFLTKWANEAGVSLNDKAMGEIIKKKLNDPDFKAFRTGMGHV